MMIVTRASTNSHLNLLAVMLDHVTDQVRLGLTAGVVVRIDTRRIGHVFLQNVVAVGIPVAGMIITVGLDHVMRILCGHSKPEKHQVRGESDKEKNMRRERRRKGRSMKIDFQSCPHQNERKWRHVDVSSKPGAN